MRRKLSALLLVLLLLQCSSALASVPYRTFTLGVDSELVQTQAAYEPVRTMTRFGEETLKNPADQARHCNRRHSCLPECLDECGDFQPLHLL